jgi:hypothetical protein
VFVEPAQYSTLGFIFVFSILFSVILSSSLFRGTSSISCCHDFLVLYFFSILKCFNDAKVLLMSMTSSQLSFYPFKKFGTGLQLLGVCIAWQFQGTFIITTSCGLTSSNGPHFMFLLDRRRSRQ